MGRVGCRRDWRRGGFCGGIEIRGGFAIIVGDGVVVEIEADVGIAIGGVVVGLEVVSMKGIGGDAVGWFGIGVVGSGR